MDQNESETDYYKKDVPVLRKRFFDGLTERVRRDEFEEADLWRFRHDDEYCESFLKHHRGNVDKSAQMVRETFKWRKEFGVYRISEDNLSLEVRKMEIYRKHHRDKEGNPILFAVGKNYVRDSKLAPELKRMFVFAVEKCSNESDSDAVTFLFDCENLGIVNLDLQMSLFVSNVLIKYYPNTVVHVLMYKMPFILDAIMKIINPLIPNHLRSRVVMVNEETIKRTGPCTNTRRENGANGAPSDNRPFQNALFDRYNKVSFYI